MKLKHRPITSIIKNHLKISNHWYFVCLAQKKDAFKSSSGGHLITATDSSPRGITNSTLLSESVDVRRKWKKCRVIVRLHFLGAFESFSFLRNIRQQQKQIISKGRHLISVLKNIDRFCLPNTSIIFSLFLFLATTRVHLWQNQEAALWICY